MDEKIALLALSMEFMMNPMAGYKLYVNYGLAATVYDNASEAGVHPDYLQKAETELEKAERLGARFVAIGDDDYPELLREIDDPPLGLFVKSSSSMAEIFQMRPAVAIVGTRDMSPYGREWCCRIVAALADARIKPLVVSGLAFGIDGVAHQACLESGLPTVAVMPTGMDEVYPYRHRQLADSIASTPGCALVTAFPTGTSPVALNFLSRNRIIAGLCSATIVIESKKKGGSLVTAKYACGYNRDVFALPGRVDDLRSLGCNSLIGTGMAGIITTAYNLVDKLGLKPGGRKGEKLGDDALSYYLEREDPDSAKRIVDVLIAISANRGITSEGLAALTGLPFPEVLRIVGTLELDGYIFIDILQRCQIKV